MASIDWAWVIAWFGIGLLSFFVPRMIPGLKSLLLAFSIILVVNLLLRTSAFGGEIIANAILTSFASSFAYLIGANIGRSIVMKIPLSLKIVYYIIVVIILAKLFG